MKSIANEITRLFTETIFISNAGFSLGSTIKYVFALSSRIFHKYRSSQYYLNSCSAIELLQSTATFLKYCISDATKLSSSLTSNIVSRSAGNKNERLTKVKFRILSCDLQMRRQFDTSILHKKD